MTVTAKNIASSICNGKRIDTLQLRYPRFIHAEFMTHRMFSRNASSSRAIPVEKLIADIRKDTAMPSHWGKNQPGMQAREEHEAALTLPVPIMVQGLLHTRGEQLFYMNNDYPGRIDAWHIARDRAIEMAEAFHKAGYHKQIVNRLLEPFSHINVIVTSTEWDNFFELRDHPDAQPEMQLLAQAMKNAINSVEPVELVFGQWHLPYVDGGSYQDEGFNEGDSLRRFEELKKISVARCARVSYLTHDGRPSTFDEDETLFNRLVGSKPLHASPLEHQATPDPSGWYKHQWGNFKGWRQYRKIWEGQSA
jgi:thymidylate synthase-like protein